LRSTLPAIISQAAFDKVQKRLALNKEQAERNVKYRYLLGRRLRCIKCGYTFVGRTRREKHQYYYCKGKGQKPVSLCDMPQFRVDQVDETVWQWIKWAMQNPDRLVEGLRAEQAITERENRALYDRLELIQEKLVDCEKRRSKILDLYLNDDFAKDELQERKTQIESTITDLKHEQSEISEHIQKTTVTDEQIAQIEATCAEVREGLDCATFEGKRRYFELLDVRGTLAVEFNEKVAYVKCKMGERQLSVVQTSP
jgi:phage-related minor tail protein